MLRRENDAHKLEIAQLKDRLDNVTRECDELVNVRRSGPDPLIVDSLEREKNRLRSDLNEREHTIERLSAQLSDRDSGTNKQKNEWAGIYGNMKRETEDLKRDIRMLN